MGFHEDKGREYKHPLLKALRSEKENIVPEAIYRKYKKLREEHEMNTFTRELVKKASAALVAPEMGTGAIMVAFALGYLYAKSEKTPKDAATELLEQLNIKVQPDNNKEGGPKK